jgi:GntR family transcriptional regulator
VLPLARSGPEPLYYQLAQSLEKAVQAGAICPGTKLPPDRDLANELKIAVGTVRNAWIYLERKGVLTRRPRTGTIVQ